MNTYPDRFPVPRAALKVQAISCVNDLYDIKFNDEGLAAVEIPFNLIDALPLVGEKRSPGPRLRALVSVVRRRGYVPRDPIICRIGMKGRWVVVDGGHRITAARMVGREFWTNLFHPKVRTLYFLLFTTPGSWSKLRPVAAALSERRREGEMEPQALGDPEM